MPYGNCRIRRGHGCYQGTVYYDSNNNEYVVNDGVLTISKGTNGTGVMESFTLYGYNIYNHIVNSTPFTSVVIAEGMTEIGQYNFETHTTNGVISGTVSLPSTLTKIGASAFSGQTSMTLTSATLPSGLAYIGDYAFTKCTAMTLSLATLPSGLTYIGSHIFLNCTAENITISGTLPSGLTYFGGLGNFTGTITGALPSGLTYIGDTACAGLNYQLTTTIPSGVTYIGRQAFSNTNSSVITGTLPSGLTSISNYAFMHNNGNGAGITLSGTLPTGITTIGTSAFEGTKVAFTGTLPSGLTSIGNGAFGSTDVAFTGELPSGLTSLGGNAFEGSDVAFTGSFPSGLTNLGNGGNIILSEYTFPGTCSFSGSIPLGVTDISYRQLYGVIDGPVILAHSTMVTLSDIALNVEEIYVPENLLNSYKTAYPYLAPHFKAMSSTVPDYVIVEIGVDTPFAYTVTSSSNSYYKITNGALYGLQQGISTITVNDNGTSKTIPVCVWGGNYDTADYNAKVQFLTDYFDGAKISLVGDSISSVSYGHDWPRTLISLLSLTEGVVDGSPGRRVNYAFSEPTEVTKIGNNGTPDYIFFMGGANDAQYGSYPTGVFDSTSEYANDNCVTYYTSHTGTEFDSFIEAYAVALWRTHTAYPDAQIIVVFEYLTMNNYQPEKMADQIVQLRALTSYLNSEYDFGIVCVDSNMSHIARSGMGDIIHPSESGANMIIQCIVEQLSTYYNNGTPVTASNVSYENKSSATINNGATETLTVSNGGDIGYAVADGSANATVTSSNGTISMTGTSVGTDNYTFFETNRGTVKNFALTVAQSYTVTFNTNGGTDVASQTIVSGSTATQPTNPTKTGNTFAGWYSDSALTTEYVWTTPITQNTTIYAKWNVDTYTVSFALNEGTGTVPSQTINYGGTVTVPNPAPTRTGYTFDGWYKGLEAYDFSGLVMSNFTLTAHWNINTYTVSFVTNNGVSINSQSVEYNGTATVPDVDLSKTGYTFGGWYKGTVQYAFSTPVTENLTLTAQWNVMDYTIVFNTNGGSAIANVSYNVESATFSLSTPTKTGYTFAGWYSNENLTGTAVTQISIGSTGDRTFYAKWTAASYTATFNVNGGNAIEAIIFTVESSDVTLPTPTRTGYTFGGWFTSSALTGTAVTKIAAGTIGDQAYYAKWTLIEYTITYHVNGGAAIADKKYTITSPEIALQTPTKTGYTFGGWFLTENLSGAAITKIAAGSTGNYDVYAKWTQNAASADDGKDKTKTTTDDKNILDMPIVIVGIVAAVIGLLLAVFFDFRAIIIVIAGVVVALCGYFIL